MVARVLWVVPVLLMLLTINQAIVAWELRKTWERGQPAIAEVLNFESSNRADVTYGYVDLRVELDDTEAFTWEKISLPQVLWSRIEDKDSLAVRVRLGSSQEVVIESLMPGHWLIAASQVGISFLGAMLFMVGAWWWKGHLRPQRQRHDAGGS